MPGVTDTARQSPGDGITGQMLASVAFDHFGWLGLAQRPVDVPRLIGVALLIGGVVLIRR